MKEKIVILNYMKWKRHNVGLKVFFVGAANWKD